MRPPATIVMPALLKMLDRIIEELPPSELRWNIRLTRGMMAHQVREGDRVVTDRLEQMATMAALLDAVAAICPEPLAQHLISAQPAAPNGPRDYAISALDTTLDAYRTLLIAAQAWLEDSGHAEAPALLARFWQFLADVNAARAVNVRPW